MKIITISGPYGAGKDSVIRELIKNFHGEYPNQLQKALYYVTRNPRRNEVHGVDILFCSEAEFSRMSGRGEFAYQTNIGAEYNVASPWSELQKSNLAITNITPEGAKSLETQIRERQGKVFKIFLFSDRKTRMARISRRDRLEGPFLERKMIIDPVKENPSNYQGFNLVLENIEGEFDKTVTVI